MMDLLCSTVRKVEINTAGMQTLDWAIVIGMIVFLIGVLLYCNRYMRNVADFLAASRCAGRYVLSISSGVAGFAVINSVAGFEMFYKAGFASQWWGMLSSPVSLILALVAWVSYRFRETRCFTLAQFYEVRYSRKFRMGAGILTWISGVVNYGIFPAVSVRFFMFFCRFPEYFDFLGISWNTYGVLLFIAIGLGVFFAICGGQIAIMVSDFIQGIFCNIAFVVFIFFIFKLGDWDVSGGYISWQQVTEAISMEPGASQINPFDTNKIKDFDIYYYILGIIFAIYGRGSWQGGMGYGAAAKSPHESRMAGILGTWRGMAQGLMLLLFPLAVIVIMHHNDFLPVKEAIEATLNNTGVSAQLKEQGLVTTALSLIMPSGLLGLFVAVMFAAMLSTDDTYMHSWGSIFIQDVLMPFRKKPLTPKQHIWLLRSSVIFVGVFAWFFSFFFRQTEYVYMFFAVTGAIVSGAGAALIGGLYWKRGGTIAAWVTYIVSAVLAIAGIVLQQVWDYGDGTGLVYWLAEHTNWQWVQNNIANATSAISGVNAMVKFPINGQWIHFICVAASVILYVVISLIEHYVFGKPDFNLEKMLHRGKYDTANEHVEQSSEVGWLARRLGITKEFTLGDKIIYGATILWTLFWFLVFIVFTIWQFAFNGVPNEWWLRLWHFKIYLTLILGVGCTIWFLIGGIIDVVGLFKALANSIQNDADDGSVVDGGNAGESASAE
ncbi:MAG: sodium:solute symporter [Lentisphaeria bacterium]|nr:sodium:solute symporter [Lentisphaeria bacterium]